MCLAQFVTNIIFGKFLLKSVITTKMYIGTAVTVLGTIIAVLFSSSSKTDEMTIDKLFALWLAPVYIFYLILMGGAIVVISSAYKTFELAEEKGVPLPYTHILKPLMYSTWSALFGTQSVVQAKVSASRNTLRAILGATCAPLAQNGSGKSELTGRLSKRVAVNVGLASSAE